ncbi:DNA-binding transcriptional regulator, CsgD family [Roseateles sp. YR242]|uniref:helix-turn-helix transcriptional regulator n=1 Tax=Roseateles sp. YR242 TaxID=1855305 RepID=UPI0008AF31AD|nr:LuxR C-terminal-related transcriptional regulator [Roseateles sp. YR242]SEL21325.1 DNA-binding transcriptional regulator, CsgD family [Roseateles sp. YR242]
MDGMLGRTQELDWWSVYRGPERRRGSDKWWRSALDAIDLGVCLVGAGGRLVYANCTARDQLGPEAPVQLVDGQVSAVQRPDQQRLEQALQDAQQRSLRHLICLGRGAQRLSLSVLPMVDGVQTHAMLVLGKRNLCGELPMLAFSREHQLTAAEQGVLQALCEGLQPQEIAQRHGVAISTVRTQIASVRAKTATESIRELVSMVAQLPPMQGVLRAMEYR